MPLEIYDMNIYNYSDLYYLIEELPFFTKVSGNHFIFNLNQTNYYLIVLGNNCCWLHTNAEKISIIRDDSFHVKFEEVFDKSPNEVRENLIFYLDIFSKGGLIEKKDYVPLEQEFYF